MCCNTQCDTDKVNVHLSCSSCRAWCVHTSSSTSPHESLIVCDASRASRSLSPLRDHSHRLHMHISRRARAAPCCCLPLAPILCAFKTPLAPNPSLAPAAASSIDFTECLLPSVARAAAPPRGCPRHSPLHLLVPSCRQVASFRSLAHRESAAAAAAAAALTQSCRTCLAPPRRVPYSRRRRFRRLASTTSVRFGLGLEAREARGGRQARRGEALQEPRIRDGRLRPARPEEERR